MPRWRKERFEEYCRICRNSCPAVDWEVHNLVVSVCEESSSSAADGTYDMYREMFVLSDVLSREDTRVPWLCLGRSRSESVIVFASAPFAVTKHTYVLYLPSVPQAFVNDNLQSTTHSFLPAVFGRGLVRG